MTRQDRALNTIFGQIELLQSLAIAGGDTQLAHDLGTVLSMALERYCERQRLKLENDLLVPLNQKVA
ncbi:hypothetical protein [Asticcacaulis sp. YBE204]|uniref:hypothetical protein n=1 Tax=Asticcacaulis sp. YBE204 TaxID=1282363 RepID=UPI0012DF38B4|nr:hypothetical protein [Asticcacaulis sp. YBE204]